MKLYLNELKTAGVINLDSSDQINVTLLGKAISHHHIKFKSLKDLLRSSFTKTTEISDLLRLVSQNSGVLTQTDFRSGDKVLLHKIASDPRLNFTLGAGKIGWEAWKKPFIFIQIALQTELAEYEGKLTPTQRSDQQHYLDQACRLLKCKYLQHSM